ncbi:hypothetical protein SK128_020391 [Halocaridina rubra]|uniref:Secreted protein n=1 Tax=Halocaridina rubra TaxID=373956 RepID=A0AAN8X920_HALRR
MRGKVHLLGAFGAIALVILSAASTRGEEGTEEEKNDEAILPRHPLYASLLRSENRRRLLKSGPVEDPPNAVYEEDVNSEGDKRGDYGDFVDGYNIPDSFSSAPSYADPTLLSAVMTQADEANFRHQGQSRPASSDGSDGLSNKSLGRR